MNATYSISRNSSDKTVQEILKALNIIEGVNASSETEGLFKRKLTITTEGELTPEELIGLGALIGTIEAGQHI